jgi:integrase
VRQRADEWGTIGMPKSAAGQRDIPMSPTVYNTLLEWKAACPKGPLGLVFLNTVGRAQPLTNIVHRMWHPVQKAIGLVDAAGDPLFNFHTLRHFFASWAIERGFTPKKLQALLGHSSIEMTFDRYGHLFPSTEDDHAKFASGEIGLVA